MNNFDDKFSNIQNNNNNLENLKDDSKTEISKDFKNNNIYQKKNLQKLTINKLLDNTKQIMNNAELISNHKKINSDNLFTPSKNANKIYRKKYINNTNEASKKTENKINDEDNKKKINENEEYDEFRNYNWEEWKRFYPEDDRFFKFPSEGIIHNQIINNPDEIYEGDLNKIGEKHGYGKYISQKIKRIGMWKRNNFTGWGKEIHENGDIFEGKFINGKLNGKGFYRNKNKNITYVGDFINSEKHGKGELFTKEYHYNGDFINNKFDGNGKIELYNEGEYEGGFKNGLFEGKGMLKWKDGSFYKGELSKGKQDGYGEETDKEGNIYKGYYLKGNKNGEGQFITIDGNIYKCYFKDGKAIKNIDNN